MKKAKQCWQQKGNRKETRQKLKRDGCMGKKRKEKQRIDWRVKLKECFVTVDLYNKMVCGAVCERGCLFFYMVFSGWTETSYSLPPPPVSACKSKTSLLYVSSCRVSKSVVAFFGGKMRSHHIRPTTECGCKWTAIWSKRNLLYNFIANPERKK